MKKIIIVLSVMVCCILTYAQQIHIEYTYVKSQVATVKENLHIKDNKVISIQDSILRKVNYPSSGWNVELSVSKSNNKTIHSVHFISEINNTKFRLFTFDSPTYSMTAPEVYLIEDIVPIMNWTIDKTSKKKIAGYTCVKAKANFRGSDIVAYYTEDLPYSVGPFKFYGLPGVILDVRVEGKSDMIWRAEKVEINNTDKVNFAPKFPSLQKITMQEYVKKNDEAISSFRSQIRSNLPFGTKITSSNERTQIEKKFEWEY